MTLEITILNMTNNNSIDFKKTILTSIFMCFFIIFSFSQNTNDDKSSFWKNVQYGGGIGLNFGDGFFSGALAPNAIYRFNTYVSAGIGLNFQYSSQRNIFKSTVLGASAIGLFSPYENIQISTEFEQLHVSRNFDEQFVSNLDDEYWYPLGFGFKKILLYTKPFPILFEELKK